MPCKPGMTGCRALCLHRQLVDNYRNAREVWERWREDEAIGYQTEMRIFQEEHPGPTFKLWLIDSKHTERTEP